MGYYYTWYEIKTVPDSALDAVIAEFERNNRELRRIGTRTAIACSKKFPGVLIVIYGEGEEPGDIWRDIYKDGDLVDQWRADVTPPPIPSHLLPEEEIQ